jgi:nitrous oxidase accessory protein NosD
MNSLTKSLIFKIIVILIIIGSIFYTSINAQHIEINNDFEYVLKSSEGYIIIPDHFPTIQEGIDNSNPGDIIFVRSGIYIENLVINQESIYLLGEDRFNTIIDGNNEESTITLSSENTIIENFTIIGGGFDKDVFSNFFRAGIRVTGSNNIICNNIFRKNRLGISGLRVTNLTIKNNSFFEDGITFTCYENDGRPKIKIKYYLHNIENNTVNGKPLYYLLNEKNKTIENREIGQLIIVKCTNFRINNVSISNTDWGPIFAFCNKCSVENCSIFNNSIALWSLKSNNNLYQFNNVSNNHYRGLILDYDSNNNKIKYNTIFNNLCGVEIEWYSNNNLVTKNNFLNQQVHGFEHQSFFSKWNKNYYDDWIGLRNPILGFLPKLIYGMPIERFPKIVMPVSIDFCPAKEPYLL